MSSDQMAEGGTLSKPDMRRALDRHLTPSLAPVSGALGALYLVVVISDLLLLPGSAARILAPLAAGSAALLLGLWLALRRHAPRDEHAHAWGAGIAMLVLANCLMHLAATGEMRNTTNLVLLLLGAGFLLLSTVWFAAVAAVSAVGWLVVILSLAHPTAPEHYAFAMAQAVLLATLVHHFRLRTVTRLLQERHALGLELVARRRAEERQAALLGVVPDLFFRMRRDGTFLDVHAGTPADLLVPPEQFVGRTLGELPFPGDLAERTLAVVERALEGGGVEVLEYALPMPGGEAAYEARVVRSGPDEVVIISRNVTERRRAENALRQSEERYRSLFDATPLPVWVFDLESLAILAVNDAAVRHYGYSREEFMALTLEDLNAPEHGEQVRGIRGREHPPEDRTGVWTHVRKDGKRLEVEISTHALVFGDRPARCAVIQDVTERRRVERLKDQLVGIAAHELRSPLTAIHGSLDLLLEGSAGLPASQRKILELALRNSERMARLVDDLLDLEKAESGQLALSRERVALDDVLVEALGLSALHAGRQGIDLRLTEVPQGAVVLGDRSRLIQVVSNLVANAVKFSPSGGTVQVSMGRREAVLRVEVSDRGPGVPEGFRHRLFQRFAQARELDRSRKGSGLGLAISRAIVEGLGGRIGHRPREGGGSVFFFELPAADLPEEVPAGRA